MILDKADLKPGEVYHVRDYVMVYPTQVLASEYPNGFLEGNLIFLAENLSSRHNAHFECVKTGEMIVVLENSVAPYVKVITERGLVGWVLTEDPRTEEQKEEASWG